MSALIKQIREYYKRTHGYDPANRDFMSAKLRRPSPSLQEILVRCPRMQIEPDPFDNRKRKSH